MRGEQIEEWIRELRPDCEMHWANESMLFVEGFHWPNSFSYKPRFSVTLFTWKNTKQAFDGYVLRSQFKREATDNHTLVNELNANSNFVRHYDKEGGVVVEMDVPIASADLSAAQFELNYYLFTTASERLQAALAATA